MFNNASKTVAFVTGPCYFNSAVTRHWNIKVFLGRNITHKLLNMMKDEIVVNEIETLHIHDRGAVVEGLEPP